ncbi:glyoxalase [Robbsia andropogonis]|uniref:Glyoxalase n=1 Tax=Robbsia andropogonis TaxID=28092 RepID=A0A0F5JYE3_9BURK|nr:glyoxalase/bleomycin resistance/dioxygenase family protein [Robbsia andropogonis]KKB62911.1 glyoxalase [Robbsia andropogonis]MCP1120341.1 glyoxalase/bleomycin resistance/dioxygenase family protein [Robbsia andropogonis]MCP1130212.1 glyoxalase/bleomycin resistance/dioxygenase family protein [Robbsia andropogonis]
MMNSRYFLRSSVLTCTLLAIGLPPFSAAFAQSATGNVGAPNAHAAYADDVSVGPQYDTTHVYVTPADLDKFVNSFIATFGGKASPRAVFTVTPTPSKTASQYVQTPVGMLSVFGFETPIPYPFGNERTGYLVSDIDQALKSARAAGADIVVDSFDDPIGKDAVIQWPGGLTMQLYWHTKAPNYAPLQNVPDNRVYVSRYEAENFLQRWLRFSHGKVISDNAHVDAGVIGRPGETVREIKVSSGFGNMVVFVTDGKLPFPFGRETSGYRVANVKQTIEKAQAAGVKVLYPPYSNGPSTTAMLEFPGGYIAEVHDGE